ncbi:hypothetical protein ACHWQZ_G002822 [Mnemiopsis leidyi]
MRISIRIPSWYTKTSEREKAFTQYEVQIQLDEDHYTRKLRYSTFRDLHKKLSVKHKNLPFPHRRIVANNQHPRFIESRRVALEEFLCEVASLQPIPGILWTFLEIDTSEIKKKNSKLPDMMAVKEQCSSPVPVSVIRGVCSGIRIPNTCYVRSNNMGNLLHLVIYFLLLLPPAFPFKDIYNGCTVLYEGCNIRYGRCTCGRTVDLCYDTFQFRNIQQCRAELFQQSSLSVRGTAAHYPTCVAAQYRPLCDPEHIGTKYCHGSCDTTCCLIASDGCLPPTNVYVPASACAAADQDVCQGHWCSKGYKCESVKVDNCPVLPCKKRPVCVVDDDFDPCRVVKCPQQGQTPTICVRRRSDCRREKCPYTFSCDLVSSYVRVSGRTAGCPHCPRLPIQESYCKNHFAARVKVKELVWSKRFYKPLGICDWYSSTVEYIVRGHPPQTALGNATLLVRRDSPCSCLPHIAQGERYYMIGMVLGHAYDDMPQILHIPSHGFIKP